MPTTVALLLVSLLASTVVRGQTQPATETTSASHESVPDLGKGAEEVAAQLRELTESLSDTGALARLEAEVAATTSRAAERWSETGALLQSNLRPATLDSLASSWEALRSQLDDVMGQIDARVRRRTADLETLTRLRESWAHALDLARKADAPASVQERAQSTLAAIEAARPAIDQRHAHMLVLQDSLSRGLQTCDDALARIDDARRQAIERIFVRQEPPVWRIGLASIDPGRGGANLASDLATKVESVRIYAQAYWHRLVLSGLIILACVVLLRRGRVRLEGFAERSGADGRAPSTLQTPYAAATLLGLLISFPLRRTPPFALRQLTLVVATTAAVFVLRQVLPVRLTSALYAAAALLVLHLTADLLQIPAGLEQVILIVELGAMAAVLLWAAVQLDRWRPEVHSPRLLGTGRALMRILALGCGASALAAALGYLDLAAFLGVGLFYAFFVTFILLAVRVVLEDVLTIGLERGPLLRVHAVAAHRTLVERRARRAIDVLVGALWIWLVLDRFELLRPIGAMLQGALAAHLRVGELDLPMSRILGFVAVVIGVYLATRLAVTVLEEDVYSRMTLPRGVPYALSTLTRYGLLLVGFLLALGTLGLDLTRITVLLSALGLGIGFGLQQIMNNFFSGLILLFERPVKVGDSIQLGDLGGDVLRIGMRSSTLRTPQGAEVIVPNSKILEEKVTNWTLSDRRRRIDLDVGVTGDTDPERIISLFLDVARRDRRVSGNPPPEALLVRFGETSADFQLRIWTDDPDWTRLRSDLAVALQRTLRAVRVQDSAGKEPASAH
jgi:potassium-dependent mechanosensitive channel